ncbi:hypothetical protein AA313_de0210429 [Arthrobotrys entomopaga]|nr:hypothetical protein AA313_de0210429 [Arthrobotrys entomopaga]
MSLFGQPASMQPSQGGNFGGVKGPSPFLPPINSNPPASTGTGLFGQPQQPAQTGTTGGLFGQSTANTGASSGGLFGQSTANSTATAGGLFGQPAAATGGGMFGQSQQQQQQPSNLFGQPQQQQQPTGGSLFGQPQPQQNTGFFGQSQQQPAQQQQIGQGSMFGSSLQQSGFGRTATNQMQQPQVQNNEVLANSYEPGPSEDKLKFDAAMRKRPNPKAVPVLVRGFNDLQLRMQQQEHQITIYRATLHGINNRLTELSRDHDLKTTIKLAEAVSRHQQLAHRTLSLSAKVQVLKNRGYALQPEEEQLRKRLEALMKTVSDPGVNGRMNEIWARMQIINQKAKQMEHEINEIAVTVDPEQIQKMATVLQTHEKGIKGLQEELQRLEEAFGKWEKEKQAMKDRQFGR